MAPRRFLWSNAVVLLLVLNLKTYCQNVQWRKTTREGGQWQHDDQPTIVNLVADDSARNSSTGSNELRNQTQNSSWIGDYWIPLSSTQQRLYSAQELRNFFANHSILFVGDSTARRAFATLYYILNSTDDWNTLGRFAMSRPDIIDVNRKRRKAENCTKDTTLQLCRSMPQNPNLHADYASLSCNSQVLKFFQTLDASRYTLIVVAYGGWHQSYHCHSTRGDRRFFLLEGAAQQTLKAMMKHQRHNLTIVWRSIPMPQNPTQAMVQETRKVNDYFRQTIQQHQTEYFQTFGRKSSLTGIDWGWTMEPRTLPEEDRINGDMPYHFGVEARIVFLQMLLHHLVAGQRKMQPTIGSNANLSGASPNESSSSLSPALLSRSYGEIQETSQEAKLKAAEGE